MKKIINKSNYIDWNFDAETISPLEFNELGITKIIPCKEDGKPQTKKALYTDGAACISKKANCSLFYLVEKKEEEIELTNGKTIKSIVRQPAIYRVAANNYNVVSEHMNAGKIFNRFLSLFKEKYGVSFDKAFGKYNLKCCVPAPINYGARNIYPYLHIYKADISSAYGYELSKPLPTANNYVELQGFHSPSDKYPFAFYPHEQKIEIYGENIKSGLDNAITTILMKKSDYSLKDLIEDIYNKKENAVTKEEKQIYKDLLNIPIGYFQRNENPVYSYITAVVINRCNERVESIKKEIESVRGNQVILINTDAVAWNGKDMPQLYTTEKKLGNFILENRDAKAYVKGAKCYQILDNDELKTVYAGLPKKFHDTIKFGEIFDLNYEAEAYEWNEETLKFDVFTINEFYNKRGKQE